MNDLQSNSNGPRPGQQRWVAETDETGLGAVDAVQDESAPRSMLGEAWHIMRRRPLFWLSSTIIAVVVIVALMPSVFAPADPRFCELSNSLGDPSGAHPLGFDRQGCDIMSRIVHGTSTSVAVGLLSTAIVTVIGVVFGALAGYIGGWLDSLLSRLTDIFFAVPFVLGAIVFMQMFKDARNVVMVAVVLAAFGWPQIARITRGAVLETKNGEYVSAARAIGVPEWRILVGHVLPNAAAPIIVYATVALGTFIVAEATLSFLGLGLPPDVVSWGGDIAKAQTSIRTDPMVLFFPSIALALTVLSFIMMGDVVRDALNPKSVKR
ncbi:ABC transporter permease [uncultured Gulosibacter sp.]|uniref:ABC transporter permease n=1 Tax=uncultured Gulosibacter sp. TaxID=1339167 RepID=UPI00288939EE|nr:ABC transporter permease [uncultured Gulosibacter sp.]